MSHDVCPSFSRDASDELERALPAFRYAHWRWHALRCARCGAYRREILATTRFVAQVGKMPLETPPPPELLRVFAAQADALRSVRPSAIARFVASVSAVMARRRWGVGAAVTLVVASGLLAFLPGSEALGVHAGESPLAEISAHARMPLSAGAMCALLELVGGALPLVALAVASRGLHLRLAPAAVACVGGLGALGGQAFAQTGCPGGDLMHLSLLHVGVVTAFILAAWGVARKRQGPRRATA